MANHRTYAQSPTPSDHSSLYSSLFESGLRHLATPPTSPISYATSRLDSIPHSPLAYETTFVLAGGNCLENTYGRDHRGDWDEREPSRGVDFSTKARQRLSSFSSSIKSRTTVKTQITERSMTESTNRSSLFSNVSSKARSAKSLIMASFSRNEPSPTMEFPMSPPFSPSGSTSASVSFRSGTSNNGRRPVKSQPSLRRNSFHSSVAHRSSIHSSRPPPIETLPPVPPIPLVLPRRKFSRQSHSNPSLLAPLRSTRSSKSTRLKARLKPDFIDYDSDDETKEVRVNLDLTVISELGTGGLEIEFDNGISGDSFLSVDEDD